MAKRNKNMHFEISFEVKYTHYQVLLHAEKSPGLYLQIQDLQQSQ